MKKVFLTFDIETDWGGRLPPSRENCLGIEHGLPWLIETLDRFGIKATFFISGEVIGLFSELFTELMRRGHEIASHGYSHRLGFESLTIEELRKDIIKSKDAILKLTGKKPFGFRTPQFRFNKHLLQVLNEADFEYDSSVCKSFYSWWRGSEGIMQVIKEHPVSVWSLLRMPAGLMWIQKTGLRFFMSHCLRRDEDMVIYAHPFDWQNKSFNSAYSFQVNAWYVFSPHNHVKNCLNEMLIRMKAAGFRFGLLSEK